MERDLRLHCGIFSFSTLHTLQNTYPKIKPRSLQWRHSSSIPSMDLNILARSLALDNKTLISKYYEVSEDAKTRKFVLHSLNSLGRGDCKVPGCDLQL